MQVVTGSPCASTISSRVVSIAPAPIDAHGVHVHLGAQLITGNDGAVVGETLVGVHHAGEINTGGIVVDECRVSCLRQDNGEGRRGNHICVPAARLPQRVVEGVFCVNCSGKFSDLFTTDNVWCSRTGRPCPQSQG